MYHTKTTQGVCKGQGGCGGDRESTGSWGSAFIEVKGEGLEFHELSLYW